MSHVKTMGSGKSVKYILSKVNMFAVRLFMYVCVQKEKKHRWIYFGRSIK